MRAIQYEWQTVVTTIDAVGVVKPPTLALPDGWRPTGGALGAWHAVGCGGGSITWTRSLQRPEAEQQALINNLANPKIPEWLAKTNIRDVPRGQMLDTILLCIKAVTLKTPRADQCKGQGLEILKLWRGIGHPDLAQFLPEFLLVARAARDCDHEMFARDIRAEGWAEGSDRTGQVPILCVLKRWPARLTIAQEWAADQPDPDGDDDTDTDTDDDLPSMRS